MDSKYILKISCSDSDLLNIYYRDSEEFNSNVSSENAGIDVYLKEDTVIPKPSQLNGKGYLVDLGIKTEMVKEVNSSYKSVHYYLEPRSSIYKYPIAFANSHGIIDKGYRGNLKLALRNTSYHDEEVFLPKHTRLAQICAPSLESISMIQLTDDLSSSVRGENGFGSSGTGV